MSKPYRVVRLHDCPHLVSDCAELLNEEWPRSLTARLHSLQKSCDSLPISLILINKENRLLGHVRVKKEFMDTTSAFVESLVVEKSERGKGFGKYLMKEAESYAKLFGFNRIYLTTTNKIGFYKSLGFVSIHNKREFFEIVNNDINLNSIPNPQQTTIDSHSIVSNTEAIPPPPPPPPPSAITNIRSTNICETLKVFMFKYI